MVCTEAVANSFANGMEFFNTFGGNPVSCAIGTAVFQTVKKRKTTRKCFRSWCLFKASASQFSQRFPYYW